MLRLIYIHGYVEDASIFDDLAPLLPTDSVLKLNLQGEFDRWNPVDQTLNVSTLAQHLAKAYQIGPDDVVVGHSMGGWIAAHLKAQTGCRAVLIASYTDQKKLLTPTHNLQIIRVLVKLGLVQSQWFANYALGKYPFDESRTLHKALIGAMTSQPRRYIYQQLRVLMASYPTPPAPPDLRIHSRSDTIVRCPDETYVETPGDHFNLVFYPDLVAAPIRTLLNGVG